MTRPLASKKRESAFRQRLGRAFDLHRAGLLRDAEQLYRRVLRETPRDAQAQHMLGVLCAQEGRLAEAFELLNSAVSSDACSAAALSDFGLVLLKLDRREEALAMFDKALIVEPQNAAALSNRGNTLAKLGRHHEALTSYERALAIRPDHAEALYNRGQALLALARFEEALASYERLLVLRPGQGDALHGRANALSGLGRFEEALANYDATLATKPTPAAHYDRANALAALGRHSDAVEGYDRSLAIRPVDADALVNRGSALLELRRFDEALASYDRALAIKPRDAAALNNRGSALRALQRSGEALSSYEEALRVEPRFVDALYNRASLLTDLKRHDEALVAYEDARALDPYHPDAHALVVSAASACDFIRIARSTPALMKALQTGKSFSPFALLSLCDDPLLHLECARSYLRERIPKPFPITSPGARSARSPRRDRIRLGYVSADFHNHATAFLIAELIELHDRSRFEVLGISFGHDDGSPMRSRLINGFDSFHDVRAVGDREAAALVQGLDIDIAVDLKGYTQGSRPELLAMRPARIQLNYLGYPGTMGADFIDYVIADPITLPFDQQPFYTERIVQLPDCYQVNDRRRAQPESIGADTSARRTAGLPEDGFVFCCFNNSHKIAQPVFDIWMRLLSALPGSVLWLLGDNAAAERNLRREAQVRSIDPQRLVFAARVDLQAHLARHRLADLFLDTLPYNAHTTASDALWAGLPLVTCQGRAFAGRVAASLLNAVGLPELVTTRLADYEALALRLASEPARLARIRERLARNRQTHPLFDTDRFRRHIEAAYTRMWEIFQRGEPPQTFAVEATA
jgi:protein O-GlcNAc transferase